MYESTPQFIFDTLKRGGPMIAVAGAVALVLGLVLGKTLPLVAGAVLLFFGLAEIVIRLLGIRTSD